MLRYSTARSSSSECRVFCRSRDKNIVYSCFSRGSSSKSRWKSRSRSSAASETRSRGHCQCFDQSDDVSLSFDRIRPALATSHHASFLARLHPESTSPPFDKRRCRPLRDADWTMCCRVKQTCGRSCIRNHADIRLVNGPGWWSGGGTDGNVMRKKLGTDVALHPLRTSGNRW